jgi:hypothetical protein
MACDIAGSSARELIRFVKNIIVIFEEAHDVFNSTLHVVEVMNADYPARCLLELGPDEVQETRDVCG